MTSVCVSNGTSSRKAGVADRIYLDTAVMSSVLPTGLVWMRPFLPYLPPLSVDVTSFCANDPPSPPNLVEATMSAVLAGGQLGAGIVAAQLILQVIQNQLWYRICKCDSGAQPTAPAGQAEPSGLISINPPAFVSPNPVGACETASSPALTPTVVSASRLFGVRLTAGGGPPRILPNGATIVHLVLHNNPVGGTPKTMQFDYWPYPTITDEDPGTVQLVPSGGTVTIDIPVVSGAYGFQLSAQTSDGSVTTNTAQADLAVYCGGQPGQLVTPCCPPDPQLTGMLTRILEYVTLIQRQNAPFAYVAGASHATLSGNGSFAVSGLLGVAIDITTLPSSYGVAGGSPEEHFGLGFISLGTADGYTGSWRLAHDGQLILPTSASAYTAVGYTLSPGVVVTIKELLREP